ncbi:MAG: aminoacyl-tRNA hydrolase [Gammaproteobacteria bacterium]|nr:aminoacyl-tRNA hydrolase [Gammaproteobacteria bacterium]
MTQHRRVPVIAPDEVEVTAVRAQGAGGQNVNKVASAIHLRFDIGQSSLPEAIKSRLLALDDRRVTTEGTIIIKAQRHRTQERNREDALERLNALVAAACEKPAPRIPTRPSRSVRRRRVDDKKLRSSVKALRRPPAD